VSADRFRVWIARLAAPLAFFFAATVLFVLVQRALESDDGEAVSTRSGTTTANTTTNPDGPNQDGRCRRFYRVREGDTLESIAARCDTDVALILELNPNIDPLALSPGDRVRVRGANQQQR
jgi:LysM repeat protein